MSAGLDRDGAFGLTVSQAPRPSLRAVSDFEADLLDRAHHDALGAAQRVGEAIWAVTESWPATFDLEPEDVRAIRCQLRHAVQSAWWNACLAGVGWRHVPRYALHYFTEEGQWTEPPDNPVLLLGRAAQLKLEVSRRRENL
jgi:hypothetical protein